jgi:ABC-type phosphate/phosphonate transport system substrate-binding protein
MALAIRWRIASSPFAPRGCKGRIPRSVREETHMGRLFLSIALLASLSGVAFGQTTPAADIAPGGKLRVGMIAITVLGGVAEPVAKFIGQKLGAAVEPLMYPNPEAYLQSFGRGEWDMAIGPRVLAPADKADSTADLWVISLV